ncbi:hypothetical protein VCRA2133E348_250013 [Vibrio crassostreae]|nr:hypothetical protein VCRA2133E348_250013 [Vibrio crassostreae]CAK3292051.1 hypothetical protein VCRA213O314_240082 [Vibrio crassostreae]CAK3846955.1 hypothetical protein VCRA212O16_230012 [Vibrio crassostreae]
MDVPVFAIADECAVRCNIYDIYMSVSGFMSQSYSEVQTY